MININSDQYHRLSLSPLCEHSWDNNIEPLVSICSITYNHGPYIKECLEGFLMQKTTFPVEILIHDDASTDGTEEIIREYEVKYPHIIKPLYEDENQWAKGKKGSKVFNFPRARGKYIAICEGDDYWTDSLKLQKQVEFLKKNSDCSLCFHASKSIRNNNPNDYTLHRLKDIPRDNKFEMKHAILGGGRFMAVNLIING